MNLKEDVKIKDCGTFGQNVVTKASFQFLAEK
jgi:hypothetical protein